MSPRRSSRARATNPLPNGATTTNSSTSSLSSGRERNTRSQQQSQQQQQKLVSPHRSNPRSQSLDEPDDIRYPPRRTRSGHDEVKEPMPPAEDEPEEEEEEEVTRCVCGNLEYPGLPAPILEEIKQRAKQGGATTPDEIADDGSGIFIQCDICKVWQHGGCVGILDDDSAPEEYFCEQCRSDLHSLSTTPTGQKFSRYRPVRDDPSPVPTPPPQSTSTRESARRAKEAARPRASAEALIAKRRPTMNSYDEQEQLLRAIEESKRDGLLVDSEKTKGKRSREASEEEETPAKRQRTGSNSSFHEQEKSTAMSSSDEALIDMKTDLRNGRNTRTREKEKEQKERERQEAVAKRKARSDRRRGDDSDAADDGGAGATSGMSSPPQPHSPQPRSHKKVSKGVVGKPRRPGRTPAARDTLPPSGLQHSLDPNDADRGRRTRSRSRSRAAESPTPDVNGNGTGHTPVINGANGLLAPDARPSRPKHMNPNRTSLNEMKKRVAGILEFVTKAQEEALRHLTNGSHEGTDGRSTPATTNGDTPEFASLNSADMLKTLRERLTGWESEFGRWGKAA